MAGAPASIDAFVVNVVRPFLDQNQMEKLNHLKPKFEAVSPRLPTASVEDALVFYCDKLGFQLGWKWGEPLTHANVCRDSISLDLIVCPPKMGPALVYIQLTGVDEYYSELKQRNVELSDLGDRLYGMRDFEIVDPGGNRLAFGEPSVDWKRRLNNDHMEGS